MLKKVLLILLLKGFFSSNLSTVEMPAEFKLMWLKAMLVFVLAFVFIPASLTLSILALSYLEDTSHRLYSIAIVSILYLIITIGSGVYMARIALTVKREGR